MTSRPLPHRLALATLLVACAIAGSAAAQTVQVTAANPNTGAQGTTSLVVKISGKNFAPGAKTDFFLSGTTNPAGVTVRGTQWVGASEVDATIDIADTASIAQFDIRVTNTTGRSGKGSDMFSVIQKSQQLQSCIAHTTCPVISLSVQFDDSTGFQVRSDGGGSYVDGVDNVTAKLRANGEFLFENGTLLPAVRGITSQYTNPLPGYSAYSLQLQPGAHFYWDIADTATIAIQELRVASSMCKGAYVKSDDSFQFYSTLFHSGIEGASTSSTGRWLITRISDTQWTVENSVTCGGDIINLRHQLPPTKGHFPDWETIGYYHVPFKLILTAQ
jgi:hypothetical protein